jgi:SAM-dependent methyltransferase
MSTGGAEAREYWDEKAREDAFHFVDNREPYGATDEERFWASGEDVVDRLLGAVGASLAPGDVVVEIGCGVGRLTRALAARAAEVRALDVSAEMLRLAREHNPRLGNVEWLLGDGTSLAGVDTASATACVSHVVFQHIPDPAITLGYVTEIGRVLQPGGWAAFQVSNDPTVHRRGTSLRGRIAARAGRAPRGMDHPNWHGSAVELPALREAAATGGMDVERVAGERTQFCLVLTRKRTSSG